LPVDKAKKEAMDNPESPPEKGANVPGWSWSQTEPYYAELARRKLSAGTVEEFLDDWTRLHDRLDETGARLSVAKDANTADKEAEERFNRHLEDYPRWAEAEQELETRLLDSGFQPKGLERPLRRMQADAAIFREANLPLQVEEAKLGTEYRRVTAGQTAQWEGREVTVSRLRLERVSTDRARREQAWRLGMERHLLDRAMLDDLWRRLFSVRLQMAKNAGFPDYRSFRWQEMHRFDYTPENCKQFQKAIEQTAVPAVARIHARRARQLGLAALKPWDLDVDPLGRSPLVPFDGVDGLTSGLHSVLARIDQQFGSYFQTMMAKGTLDLENRTNKANGGYCTYYPVTRVPAILMNAIGTHGDVRTLIHECGHACHDFETQPLPWFQQRDAGGEFAEVASMGMEFLAVPCLSQTAGGFYSDADAARALAMELEQKLRLWPAVALVDAFQHWACENPRAALETANCDREWTALWSRLTTGVDWSGFEDAVATGWQRHMHIFLWPFYYLDYGLAQLGACQIWTNALKDRTAAIAAYRRALALGGTMSPDKLYQAAGAKLAFDAGSLGSAVGLIAEKLDQLAVP
jgi:oligoendopeptidase F